MSIDRHATPSHSHCSFTGASSRTSWHAPVYYYTPRNTFNYYVSNGCQASQTNGIFSCAHGCAAIAAKIATNGLILQTQNHVFDCPYNYKLQTIHTYRPSQCRHYACRICFIFVGLLTFLKVFLSDYKLTEVITDQCCVDEKKARNSDALWHYALPS